MRHSVVLQLLFVDTAVLAYTSTRADVGNAIIFLVFIFYRCNIFLSVLCVFKVIISVAFQNE